MKKYRNSVVRTYTIITNLKIFNQLNFFVECAGDFCCMENIKNRGETNLTFTSAWNETEREAIKTCILGRV